MDYKQAREQQERYERQAEQARARARAKQQRILFAVVFGFIVAGTLIILAAPKQF